MTVTKEDILNDREFKGFVRSKDLKKNTIDLYVTRLRVYCDFHDKTISELIEEAEEEQDSGKIKLRRRKVNERIGDFVDFLIEKGLAYYTIRGYVESIKAVYNFCEIDTARIGIPGLDRARAFEELITLDEIKLAVQNASTRDKALILTHMSSGMGMAEVRSLKYKHFLKGVEEFTGRTGYIDPLELVNILKDMDDVIPTWKMIRVKTGYPFLTFTSPEMVRATLEYLKFRQQHSHPINNIEDPLFISNIGNPISKKAHILLFQRYNDKLGLGRKDNTFRRFTSHELRRFFGTSCIRARVSKMETDWMMGHAIDEQDAGYFRVHEAELKRTYLDVLPYLTLDEIKRIEIDSPEVKELRKELKEARKANAEFNERMKKWDESIILKSDEDLETLRKTLSEVSEKYKDNPDNFEEIEEESWNKLKKKIN